MTDNAAAGAGGFECVDPRWGERLARLDDPQTNPAERQGLEDHLFICDACRLQRAAEAVGGPLVAEIFADRTYEDDGTLRSRQLPGAVIHDADAAAEHVLRMVGEQAITSINGVKIPVRPQTICVHGDNPEAVRLAARVRERLEQAGIAVERF